MKAPAWVIAGTVVLVGGFFSKVLWDVDKLVNKTDIPGTVQRINTALDNINRPCKGPAGPDACGTLAQVNKTTIAVGNAVNLMGMQVRQSGAVMQAAAGTIAQTGDAVTYSAAHLDGAVDKISTSVSGTADQATATLDTIDTTVKVQVPPLLHNLDDSITSGQNVLDSAHAFLSGSDFLGTVASVNKIGVSAAHFADTLDTVSTKATYSYIHPSHNPVKRVWEASSPFVYPAVRIGASLAPLY